MTTLLLLLCGLTLIGLVGYAFQVLSVRQTLMKRGIASGSMPAISILKPLKGLDDNLFDNLESFCSLDYPEYEIIFCLQDYNDPAYKIARKVKEHHPERDITLLVSRCNEGLNPKVNNLLHAYKIAKHPLILISDSNVMVERDYLRSIVAPMSDCDVGLVSNLIIGSGGHSIGSILENLHLNSFIIGSVCFLDRFLKMPCVIGKSMLMRRSDIESLGGLKAFKDVLAEDYVIGRRMHESGKKVALSEYAIYNVNKYWGIGRFLNRHTRWGKLRLRLGGIRYAAELIANPVFLSLLPLILTNISYLTISIAVFTAAVKTIGDIYLSRLLKTPMRPLLYTLVPIKDLIIGLIWFVPLFSNVVMWRGNRYIIGKDTLLKPYPESEALRYRVVNAIRARFA